MSNSQQWWRFKGWY